MDVCLKLGQQEMKEKLRGNKYPNFKKLAVSMQNK
jgi:hypothetical protein